MQMEMNCKSILMYVDDSYLIVIVECVDTYTW